MCTYNFEQFHEFHGRVHTAHLDAGVGGILLDELVEEVLLLLTGPQGVLRARHTQFLLVQQSAYLLAHLGLVVVVDQVTVEAHVEHRHHDDEDDEAGNAHAEHGEEVRPQFGDGLLHLGGLKLLLGLFEVAVGVVQAVALKCMVAAAIVRVGVVVVGALAAVVGVAVAGAAGVGNLVDERLLAVRVEVVVRGKLGRHPPDPDGGSRLEGNE